MFGGTIKGGSSNVAQCAGHDTGCFEPGSGGFCQEAKWAKNGFELSSRGSAEKREARKGLRDNVIDVGEDGRGIGNPSAAFGCFKWEACVKESG